MIEDLDLHRPRWWDIAGLFAPGCSRANMESLTKDSLGLTRGKPLEVEKKV